MSSIRLALLPAALVSLTVSTAFAQADWRQRMPATPPSPRFEHALAHDIARGRTLLFGGRDESGTIFGDTWEWDGTEWSQLDPASSPAPRVAHAMVYDPVRGTIVLFGGDDGGVVFQDTWEWTGSDWTDVSPGSSPPARSRHAMARDAARGVIVVFGGSSDQGTSYLGDTWEWNGSTWTDAGPTTPPSPRERAAMAYLSGLGRLVLYGGSRINDPGGPVIFDETWEYDGLRWTQATPPGSPTFFLGYAASHDTIRDRILLVGFRRSFPRPLFVASEYDGRTWARLEFRTIPNLRSGHALAYDPSQRQTLMFGGFDGFSAIGETWEYGNAPVFLASVIPQTGSELGGDFVTVRGGTFTTVEDTQVFFDGVQGTVLSIVDPGAFTALPPPGTGEVTVTVTTSGGDGVLERGFRYLAPAIAARLGNVNTGIGDREDVLTVNNSIGDPSTRVLSIGTTDQFVIEMASPSSRESSRFVLYAWVGSGTDATVAEHPFDLGRTVFPTPLSGGPGRQPKQIWKNIPGHERQLGSETLPSTPAPSTVFTAVFGTRRMIIFALQGFIIDDGSHIPERASVTNAVIVDAR